jgi:nucleoside-diphosphate-sugar epimerase
MAIRNKRIFVTGGAGFIGTALIARLINDNEIVVYDTLQRNSLKNTEFINHPKLSLIQGDILDKSGLMDAIKGADVVVHLAAIAGVDTVITSPTTTMRVNLLGTSHLVEAAASLERVDKVVNFSTSEVYGSYAYKLEERDNTSTGAVGEARWTYATSKLAGEHLCYAYFKEFGLPVASIRPFNVYGPGQVGEGAIHTFIKQATNDEDVTIVGTGDQIRSWCYIDDVVEAVILCIENEEAVGEVFNIGNPLGTITVLSLAEKIVGIAGSKSKIVFVPLNYVDVELRIPSIEKAKKILRFHPKVSLDDGIRKTIEWYRKQSELAPGA